MKKHLYILLAVFMFSYLPATAQNVAFLCIENADSAKESERITKHFEEFFFDRLFEEGFIAACVPFFKGEKSFYDNVKKIKSEFENPPAYLLLFYFSYSGKSEYDPNLKMLYPKWNEISWKFMEFDSELILEKKTVKFEKKESNPFKKAEELAAAISSTVSSKIRRAK